MIDSIDPRIVLIKHRFSDIKTIIPIMSSKGGTGKSIISAVLAYTFTKMGFEVGLLDLDITNPSLHVVLGVDIEKTKPIEEKGVIPPRINNLSFMSIEYYFMENPTPLRGSEISNAIKELLAITIWNKKDFVFIDTPPGLSDEVLDIIELIPRIKPIVIAIDDPMTMKATNKLITMLKSMNIEILGLLENMAYRLEPSTYIKKLCDIHGIEFLGLIPYVKEIRSYIGNIDELYNILKPYIDGIAKNIMRLIEVSR